jgi:peroxidase
MKTIAPTFAIPPQPAALPCGVLAIAILIGSALHGQENAPPPSSPNSMKKERRGDPEPLPRPVPRPGTVTMGPRAIDLPSEFRTIDGTGNNVAQPQWGSAEQPFLRFAPVDYADGASTPAGPTRPSARAISNALCATSGAKPNTRGASDFVWQWGQFLDHDLDLTPVADPVEPFDVAVPSGDPFFDPAKTGAVKIGLDRSFFMTVNGIREQVNEITAYIDASNVYGSDSDRAFALRDPDGTGRLLTSAGNLLPFNTEGLANAPTAHDPSFFVAGDFRANEQVGLTTMHTLFVREHNHWADAIKASNPQLTGDQIYESARVIVAAEIQAITYREFLPVLLGSRAIPRYEGYDARTNAGIANEFATSAYRFGHSMLSATLLRLDRKGKPIAEGNLPLAKAFFTPDLLIKEGGIDPIIRGLASQQAQQIDPELVDDVRNFLFGAPGAGGFDLASLNLQRGRDHGLASYNKTRIAYGLKPAKRFSDLTKDKAIQKGLASVYADPDQIDLWIGSLCEPPFADAMVGETLAVLLRHQFLRLRRGDRFWYERYLTPELRTLIERQTLAVIIRRNTEIGRELQDNVFLVPRPAPPGHGGKGQPVPSSVGQGGPPPRASR